MKTNSKQDFVFEKNQYVIKLSKVLPQGVMEARTKGCTKHGSQNALFSKAEIVLGDSTAL